MRFKYDLFISYAGDNKDIADYIVDKIEKRGFKCFEKYDQTIFRWKFIKAANNYFY